MVSFRRVGIQVVTLKSLPNGQIPQVPFPTGPGEADSRCIRVAKRRSLLGRRHSIAQIREEQHDIAVRETAPVRQRRRVFIDRRRWNQPADAVTPNR